MFLSFALYFLIQNPTFHWDQEVDQSYWQALHLLEVENDPSGALDILQSLEDEPSVLQYRGQASIIMAQTYRALLRAGRKQEAADLLPVIRRESLRTEYEIRVEGILAKANAYQNPAEELDPDFISLVEHQIIRPHMNNRDIRAVANAYGDRLSPYLIHFVESEQYSGLEAQVFSIAVLTQNRRLVDYFSDRIPTLDSQVLAGIIKTVPSLNKLSLKSMELYSDFLIQILNSEKILPSSLAIQDLAELSWFELPRVRAVLLDLLSDEESVLQQYFLAEFVAGKFDCWPMIIADRILGKEDEVANTLRSASYRSGDMGVLLALAKKGDRNAQLTAAYLALPIGLENTYSINRHKINYTGGACRQNWSGDVDWIDPPLELPEFKLANANRAKFYEEGVGAIVKALALEENEKYRELGFLLALRFRDLGLAKEILDTIPVPKKLAVILPINETDPWLDACAEVIDDTPEGQYAAVLILNDGYVLKARDMVKLCRPEFFPLLDRYWRGVSETPRGSDEMVVFLKNHVQPPYADLALREFMSGSSMPYSEYFAQFLADKRRFAKSGELLSAKSDGIGRQLLMGLEGSGELDPSQAQLLGTILDHLLGKKIADERERMKVSQRLESYLDRMLRFGGNVRPLVIGAISDENRAREFVALFNDVVPFSAEVTEHLLENYPKAIHEGNIGSLVRQGGIGSLSLIRHPDPKVSEYIVRGFGETETSRVVAEKNAEFIFGLLDSPGHASQAIGILTRFGIFDTEKLVPKIVSAWENPELKDRAVLMGEIARIYHPDLVPVISEGLQHSSFRVSRSAQLAFEHYAKVRDYQQTLELWRLSGDEGSPTEFLISKILGSNRPVRLASIDSLATLGAVEALPILVKLMEDEDREVATAAAAAVKKINAVKGDMKEE